LIVQRQEVVMVKKFLFGLLILFAFGSGIGFFDLNAASEENAVNSRAENVQVDTRTDKAPEKKQILYKWHQSNLERHFQKHRAEFPEYKTAAEYGKGAVEFFSKPPKGTELKRRNNGDKLFYYEKRNIFGVSTKDGFIKTFFRPDKGKKYWQRQKGTRIAH
jgi:pyocin large subunit-like protein